MLKPWRGRPYLYKVVTQFTLHRCCLVVVDSQRICIYHDWQSQPLRDQVRNKFHQSHRMLLIWSVSTRFFFFFSFLFLSHHFLLSFVFSFFFEKMFPFYVLCVSHFFSFFRFSFFDPCVFPFVSFFTFFFLFLLCRPLFFVQTQCA